MSCAVPFIIGAFAASIAFYLLDKRNRQRRIDLLSAYAEAYFRINHALSQVTPKANATVRRIERILKGEG